MNGLPRVPLWERAYALAVLLCIILLPWVYIGTGIYVWLERPGFTPYVAFVLGHLATLLACLFGYRLWLTVSQPRRW